MLKSEEDDFHNFLLPAIFVEAPRQSGIIAIFHKGGKNVNSMCDNLSKS